MYGGSQETPHGDTNGPDGVESRNGGLIGAVPPPHRPYQARTTAARRDGVSCPLCSRYTASQARNLVRHLASKHRGQELGTKGANTLHGCDLGICRGCRSIRSYRSNHCQHCAPPVAPPRPAEAGDTVTCPPALARVPLSQPEEQPPIELPQDWAPRVRALLGVTVVHIPRSLRDGHAKVIADCLDALVTGGPACQLEQGRSKLSMAPVPKSLHAMSELELRLRMWHDAEFEALLTRREAQVAAGRGQARSRRTGMKCSRARQLVREGAFMKGVTALAGFYGNANANT